MRRVQGRQSAGAVEHSDGEGAERVGKAVGGGAPGLRRAEEARRMAAKGGPAPGAGGSGAGASAAGSEV